MPIPRQRFRLINTYTAGRQFSQQVTALSGGGFVVTWVSVGQDGSDKGIYGQQYSANASQPVGGEFRVNTNLLNAQERPRVAALSDGGYVVTWQSMGQDGSWDGIYAQCYDMNGCSVAGEFRVNTYVKNSQWMQDITPLPDGGFVVVWHSGGQDGSGHGVYCQRYSADGLPVGGETAVNLTTANDERLPQVLALAGENFVVSWIARVLDGSGSDVYLRVIGQAGWEGGAGDDLVLGSVGNEMLWGDRGDDTLIGGEGDDIAVFSGGRLDYQLIRDGMTATVIGADGIDVVTDVEAEPVNESATLGERI